MHTTHAIVPEIKTIAPKKLIGQRINTSIANNNIAALWRGFMPKRHEVTNAVNTDLISMSVYASPAYFSSFNPATMFDKWAAVEVENFNQVPAGMETYELPGGLYAVFHYKGLPTDTGIFQYIFAQWLPQSGYVLDDRAHFEVLGDKFKRDSAESEEDIYIPVKRNPS